MAICPFRLRKRIASRLGARKVVLTFRQIIRSPWYHFTPGCDMNRDLDGFSYKTNGLLLAVGMDNVAISPIR